MQTINIFRKDLQSFYTFYHRSDDYHINTEITDDELNWLKNVFSDFEKVQDFLERKYGKLR